MVWIDSRHHHDLYGKRHPRYEHVFRTWIMPSVLPRSSWVAHSAKILAMFVPCVRTCNERTTV